MSRDKPQQGCLYMTYNSFKEVMHARGSEEGTNGFLEYMHGDLSHVVQKGHNTNLWLSYFHFPDRRDIPSLQQAASDGYYNKVVTAAKDHNASCRYTINMHDALFCIEHDIVPLTPDAECAKLRMMPDYLPVGEFGDNMPRQNACLPQYRAYEAIQTELGVLLFSYTPEGQRQREEYERYHEQNFFSPSQPGGMMRYYEVIAEPQSVKGAVDILPQEGNRTTNALKDAYVDEEILSDGRLMREYNMTPNGDNYELFRRRQPPGLTKEKKLLDMTLGEMWKAVTTPYKSQSNTLTCTEDQRFPGEKQETTFKIKR